MSTWGISNAWQIVDTCIAAGGIAIAGAVFRSLAALKRNADSIPAVKEHLTRQDEHMARQDSKLDEIVEQTTRSNGRLGVLEANQSTNRARIEKLEAGHARTQKQIAANARPPRERVRAGPEA